jgi:hypothetical protein
MYQPTVNGLHRSVRGMHLEFVFVYAPKPRDG